MRRMPPDLAHGAGRAASVRRMRSHHPLHASARAAARQRVVAPHAPGAGGAPCSMGTWGGIQRAAFLHCLVHEASTGRRRAGRGSRDGGLSGASWRGGARWLRSTLARARPARATSTRPPTSRPRWARPCSSSAATTAGPSPRPPLSSTAVRRRLPAAAADATASCKQLGFSLPPVPLCYCPVTCHP